MLSVEKVATPLIAATVVVPESVAPLVPVFAMIVNVTSPVKLASVWPDAARAVTCTAGLRDAPAVVLVGWTVNTSWVARVLVMLKGVLVAAGIPAAVAVSV